MPTVTIAPQPGPQTAFLSTPADICVYGGQAGGGKTYGVTIDVLRHANTPGFGAVMFRRTSPELEGPGSLWALATEIYPAAGAELRSNPRHVVTFKSGATIEYTHLQHERDKMTHHGKAYAAIYFDELTQFLESQFWYLLSRNRSTCGVKPYVRATCNPDPDSFVRGLIDWWIGDDGLPIPERDGLIRWFVRHQGALFWDDDPDALRAKFKGSEPLSFTFISASLADNPALVRADPGYRARLEALPEVEREQLLGGNWNVRPAAGKYINRDWFGRYADKPDALNIYMASDYAVTHADDADDPDYTEFGIFGVDAQNNIWVLDWWHGQTKPDEWIAAEIELIRKWEPLCAFAEAGVIRRAIDPLRSRMMREANVYQRTEWITSIKDKATRGRGFQGRAHAGYVQFPARLPWADRVIEQCHGFTPDQTSGHDDAFDVMSLMCRVLDMAHPAILDTPPQRQKRDRYALDTAPERSWRTR